MWRQRSGSSSASDAVGRSYTAVRAADELNLWRKEWGFAQSRREVFVNQSIAENSCAISWVRFTDLRQLVGAMRGVRGFREHAKCGCQGTIPPTHGSETRQLMGNSTVGLTSSLKFARNIVW